MTGILTLISLVHISITLYGTSFISITSGLHRYSGQTGQNAYTRRVVLTVRACKETYGSWIVLEGLEPASKGAVASA